MVFLLLILLVFLFIVFALALVAVIALVIGLVIAALGHNLGVVPPADGEAGQGEAG